MSLQIPKNLPRSSAGARSVPRVILIPLPKPLPIPARMAAVANAIGVVVKGIRPRPRPRRAIQAVADQRRPKRSMMSPAIGKHDHVKAGG